MKYVECDTKGCNVRSPNDRGIHIANGWLCVITYKGTDTDLYKDMCKDEPKQFCNDCANRILYSINISLPKGIDQ